MAEGAYELGWVALVGPGAEVARVDGRKATGLVTKGGISGPHADGVCERDEEGGGGSLGVVTEASGAETD